MKTSDCKGCPYFYPVGGTFCVPLMFDSCSYGGHIHEIRRVKECPKTIVKED